MSDGLDLKHYPLSRDNIPNGWAATTISEIAPSPHTGFACGRHNSIGEGVPHLRPMNVSPNGAIDLDDIRYVPEEYDSRRLKNGDVLFNNTNSPAWVGKTAAVDRELELAFSNHMTVIRPADGVNPRFIARQLHFLQQCGYFLHKCKNHVNQASINKDVLSTTVPILLAPQAEQDRIADRVEELFTDLDAGVAALQRVQKKLKRYRAALLHAAVTGRLTADWRAKHGDGGETGSQLLERILVARQEAWEERTLAEYEAKEKVPPKKWKTRYKTAPIAEAVSDIEIPQTWCWSSVGQLSTMVQYGTSSKTNEDSSGVPVLRMGNLTTDGKLIVSDLKFLPIDHSEFPALLLECNDLVFNRTNSAELVGKTAVFSKLDGNWSFASYLIRVRSAEAVQAKWIAACINSPLGRRWAQRVLNHTAGQANINGSKLSAFTIPLPPVDEQAAIADEIDERISQIEQLIHEVERGLRRSGRLRQAILKAAFEGKLVPQNPDDEPASELLARIQAEAEAEIAAAPKRTPRKRKATKKTPSKKETA